MVRETLEAFADIPAVVAGGFCPRSKAVLASRAVSEKMVFTVAPSGGIWESYHLMISANGGEEKHGKCCYFSYPCATGKVRCPNRVASRTAIPVLEFSVLGEFVYARNRRSTRCRPSDHSVGRRSSFPRQRPPIRRRKSPPAGP